MQQYILGFSNIVLNQQKFYKLNFNLKNICLYFYRADFLLSLETRTNVVTFVQLYFVHSTRFMAQFNSTVQFSTVYFVHSTRVIDSTAYPAKVDACMCLNQKNNFGRFFVFSGFSGKI